MKNFNCFEFKICICRIFINSVQKINFEWNGSTGSVFENSNGSRLIISMNFKNLPRKTTIFYHLKILDNSWEVNIHFWYNQLETTNQTIKTAVIKHLKYIHTKNCGRRNTTKLLFDLYFIVAIVYVICKPPINFKWDKTIR